jgi:protein-S-isoprenylcysteine O-methyltransferase Ste14
VTALGLGIYLAFLLTAFGLRAGVQYYRTGDHGLRLLSGSAGTVGWFPKVLLFIGVVLAGAAPGAELMGFAKPPSVLDTPWLRAAGVSLALLGFAITVVSQFQMGASWRVGVDEREITPLIRTGLFRFVRNPIFTGMVLATAGLLMMVPNMFSAVAFPSVFVGLEMQVRWIEEPYLSRVHGIRYLSYARVVGRFVPGIGRLT